MSSALIRWKVTPEGGEPFEVEANSRDVLMWERAGRGNSFSTLIRQQSMADMYRIAHIAARRLGLFTGDLVMFEETCDLEALSELDEGEAESPTRPAQ